MKPILTIAKRELSGYFASPVAFVFIVIFLLLSGFFTFMVAGLFERGQANLETFFTWHPWLYLFLVPAVGMRMWSEERRLGTIELLLTMPVTPWQAIVGKFLAAWAVVGVALALTFPVWITVNYLGNPDNGIIFAGYLGSLFLAGSYLAITCMTSAMTRNQVVAFILSVVISESPLIVRAFPRKQIASEDLARAVGEVALKERWPLLELHTEEGRLDEVFRRITLTDTKASLSTSK